MRLGEFGIMRKTRTKEKVEIIGPKVHGVGYRYFLMNQAMLLGVDGFAASNQAGIDRQQKVLVLVEGSREALIDFSALAETEKPEEAEVSEVLIGDFDGFVPKMTDFAMVLTAGQIVKAIPIIQEIESNTKETAESLREERLLRIEQDIHAIKAKLGMS
ncbi:hypothetical protein Mhar_1699 [Methanothrix harundinacea 6Ac]|uniref:Acylphosphatase-like domain-containing protein n=2 Tax=Methanothrix harundinacea TaxID=301375 RepID=G7WQ26_METH6|nr:hypothetical protein Mhar_1699 [Methanothrix harundinacea 6Ac]